MSTQKQPSLQSILKRRQQEEFIGREEQINLFRQNLTYSPEDERRRFIFSASGQGGVGKTTLLRLFSKLATETNAKVAWVDETIEDMPAAMAYLAKQLEGQDHAFNTFNERYRTYLQHLHELEADPEAPQGSLSFISQALTKIGVSLGRRIPIAGGALDLVDEKVLASQVGAWSEYVKRKLTNKDELQLLQKPLDTLTPLFLEGLAKEAEKRCVVLFLDTYERIGEYLDSWLRKLLDGFYGDVPSNIIIVIAGRHELDKNNWIIYEGLLVRFELEPFTESEALECLAHKGITDKRTVEVILHLSGKFPLLLATLASESPSNPDEVGDPSGTAIERFLKWEDDMKYRQLLIDAALPRFLNRDIMAVLSSNENADSFFTWLKQKPFIEHRGKGWIYHEVVPTQMLHYKHRESPQDWVSLHKRLSDYYEKIRSNLGLNAEQKSYNTSWYEFTLEMHYHYFCQVSETLLNAVLDKQENDLHNKAQIDDFQPTWMNQWRLMVWQAARDSEVAEIVSSGLKRLQRESTDLEKERQKLDRLRQNHDQILKQHLLHLNEESRKLKVYEQGLLNLDSHDLDSLQLNIESLNKMSYLDRLKTIYVAATPLIGEEKSRNLVRQISNFEEIEHNMDLMENESKKIINKQKQLNAKYMSFYKKSKEFLNRYGLRNNSLLDQENEEQKTTHQNDSRTENTDWQQSSKGSSSSNTYSKSKTKRTKK